jgi:hypothetical protein
MIVFSVFCYSETFRNNVKRITSSEKKLVLPKNSQMDRKSLVNLLMFRNNKKRNRYLMKICEGDVWKLKLDQISSPFSLPISNTIQIPTPDDQGDQIKILDDHVQQVI